MKQILHLLVVDIANAFVLFTYSFPMPYLQSLRPGLTPAPSYRFLDHPVDLHLHPNEEPEEEAVVIISRETSDGCDVVLVEKCFTEQITQCSQHYSEVEISWNCSLQYAIGS